MTDTVQGLGDGRSRRGGLLPRVERYGVRHERRGREPINSPSCTDDAAQRTRHQEPLRDPLRSREHQSLHAGR